MTWKVTRSGKSLTLPARQDSPKITELTLADCAARIINSHVHFWTNDSRYYGKPLFRVRRSVLGDELEACDVNTCFDRVE